MYRIIRKTVILGLDVKGFALSGTITNISNDCDKLDKPIDINLKQSFRKDNRNA